MNETSTFSRLHQRLVAEPRVTAWHVSLFMAILHVWEQQGKENPVFISRKILMQLARMHSCMTYHKCLRQLQEFGFIRYLPSFNPLTGSQLHLISHESTT